MSSSTPHLPTERLAVGQLLVRLLYEFRTALFDAVEGTEFADLRFAHNQIWGNVGVDGIRLTAACQQGEPQPGRLLELVNELQSLGYLERRPDPADGRAKLICPTPRGRRLLDAAGERVAELKQGGEPTSHEASSTAACTALDRLLAAVQAGRAPASRCCRGGR